MSKLQKSQKIHNSQNLKIDLLKSNPESDNEIELKNTTTTVPIVSVPAVSVPAAPTTAIVKPKKKRNISEEQKQKLRERLEVARLKKSKQKQELKSIQEEFLKSRALELNNKVINNAKKISKKQEQEYMKNFMREETLKSSKTKNKKEPVFIYENDSSESDDSNEEPIIIKKVPRKKTVAKPKVEVVNEPVYVKPEVIKPRFVVH
jgi:hypothetical protein